MESVNLWRLNPAITFWLPTPSTSKQWVATDQKRMQTFELDDAHALTALLYARPQTRIRAIAAVGSLLGIGTLKSNTVIDNLEASYIILPAGNEKEDVEDSRLKEIRRLWWSYGWIYACEYFLATYDQPFINGTKEGRQESASLMRSYADQTPDIERQKTYKNAFTIALPDPHSALSSTQDTSQNSFDLLSPLLALCFGVVEKRNPDWNGAPLLLRTSPSGGARQSSEAYLVARNLNGISPGIYHIRIDPCCLELIGYLPEGAFDQAFDTILERSSFSVHAVIVITTKFERNMFRYRESRTYRSVHIEAGHICANLEALLASAGINTFVQYGPETESLYELLKLHPLDEGIQATVGMGAP